MLVDSRGKNALSTVALSIPALVVHDSLWLIITISYDMLWGIYSHLKVLCTVIYTLPQKLLRLDLLPVEGAVFVIRGVVHVTLEIVGPLVSVHDIGCFSMNLDGFSYLSGYEVTFFSKNLGIVQSIYMGLLCCMISYGRLAILRLREFLVTCSVCSSWC